MAGPLDQLQGRDNPRQYREQLQADIAETGYTDDHHRRTQGSFRSQQRLHERLGLTVNFDLRDFPDATIWANPQNLPASVDPTSHYLTNMARAQARAIVALQDRMAKSPLGRALLDAGHEGHVQFSFGRLPDPGWVAGYLDRQRQVVYNTDGELLNAPDSAAFMSNAIIDTSHELGHMGQAKATGSMFSVRDYGLAHQERLLALRHYEAAATAASVQVAWELAERGDDGPWQAMTTDGPDQASAQAFAAVARQDPAAITDGRARRAAHDAWFTDSGRQTAYEDAMTQSYRQVLTALAMQQEIGYPHGNAQALATMVGTKPAEDGHLIAAGAMPDGINHLTVPGGKSLRDPAYTAMANPRITEQVAFLDRIAAKFRAGEQVTPVMLNGYDAIAQKYAGTDYAQDTGVPPFGEGIPGEPEHPLDRINPINRPVSPDPLRPLDRWRADRSASAARSAAQPHAAQPPAAQPHAAQPSVMPAPRRAPGG